MNWKRTLRHLFTDHWSVRRAFPPVAMRAIEKTIGEEEQRHAGQMRFAVEASLPFGELLRGARSRERAVGWFGHLGVAGATVALSRRAVRYHELDAESGVRVESVEPGGRAKRSGVEPGDIIIRYDGERVAGIDDLQRTLTAERIGKATTVTLLRRAQKLELPIQADELPPRQ